MSPAHPVPHVELPGREEAVAAQAGRPSGEAVPVAPRSVSPRTARQYENDWAAFRAWCYGRGAPALPAAPALVAAYLAERSATRGRSGLRVILAAIAHHHRLAGHPWTPGYPTIARAQQDNGRKEKRPVRPAAALSSAALRHLVADLGGDLAGLRDRALLLLGFAGALRRSELVALDHEDVRFTAGGLVLGIRSRKASRDGQAAEVALARGGQPELCPVRAMEAWLRRAGIEYGPVFRRLTAAGTMEGRLTGNGVWKVLRRRAEAAGLSVAAGQRLSPHGLRAGAIAEAALQASPQTSPARHKPSGGNPARSSIAATAPGSGSLAWPHRRTVEAG